MSKKKFMILLGVLLLGAFAAAGNIAVSTVSYDPSPAIPGSYLNLSVTLANNSTSESSKAVFNLKLKQAGTESTFPFALDPGDTALKNLGNLSVGQATLVKYRILIDPKALDGTYTVYLETGEDGKVLRSTPYSIRVLSTKPIIEVISATPSEAEIGKATSITLKLKNTGSSIAYDLSVGLSEERTVTTTGTVVERDIVSLGTSTAYLEHIDPGQTEAVTLPILVNPTASPKAYYIPLGIGFFDSQKTEYSETKFMGLKVFDKPNLGINATPAEKLYPGKKTKITLELFNAGSGTAKFLNLKAKSDFASFKQSEYYIGSLESDDYDSVTLDAEVSQNAIINSSALTKGTSDVISVELSFQDNFGQEFTVEKKIPITVFNESEALQGSSSGNSLLPAIAVIAVIAVIAWLLFFRKKKAKN